MIASIIYIICNELILLFFKEEIIPFKILLFIGFLGHFFLSDSNWLEKKILQKKNLNKLIEILYSINSKTLLINSNKYVYIKEYDFENLEFFRFVDKIKVDFDFDSRLLEVIKNSKIQLTQVGLVHYNKFKEEQKLWG
ncbi:MAG: hypothetical protein ACO25K_07670 [Candidatus Fonsibacter ubiquis]